MNKHLTRQWCAIIAGAVVVVIVTGLGFSLLPGGIARGAAGTARTATGPAAAGSERSGSTGMGGPHTGRGITTGASDGASACGSACFSLYSEQLGARITMNVALPRQTSTSGKVGRKVDMLYKGLSHPSGEFTTSLVARVYKFCGTDKYDFFSPTSFLCRHEASFSVFEVNWSPFGNQTQLCVGVAVAGEEGENVTLRPCGRDARTLWIADYSHRLGSGCRATGSYCPWISGADSNFRSPFVLTFEPKTLAPPGQLRIERLRFVHGGVVGAQQFSFVWGMPGV